MIFCNVITWIIMSYIISSICSGKSTQSVSKPDHEDVIITNSVSQSGESSPQLYSEQENESVIRTDNASQEKESPHESYSQQKMKI